MDGTFQMDSLLSVLQRRSQHLHEGSEARYEFLRGLPKLREEDIGDIDDTCPICQETFLSVIALEEMALVMDTPGLPVEQLGVTKLPCGHRYCRKDISVWISSLHNTCPSCRSPLPLPPVGRSEAGSDVDGTEVFDPSTWSEEERSVLNAALAFAQANGPDLPNRNDGMSEEQPNTFFRNAFIPPAAREDDYELDREYSSMYS